MTARNILTRGAAGLAGAALLAGALSIPTAASAQYYQPQYQGGGAYGSQGYYDPCRRDQVQRGTGGALIGGGLGALAGSGIAGRGAKTEGAVLGGILGAVIGSNVGKSGAACSTPYDPSYRGPASSQGAYYDDRYDDQYREPAYQPYPEQAYDDRYDRYDDNYRMAPIADGPAQADNCTLAESPIYLPDGRTQKRFVRVCRDAQGNYQVVD